MRYKLILFLLLCSQSVKASHVLGGEITWQCLKSGPNTGKYIFTLKIYSDCLGIPFVPPTQLKVYTTTSNTTNNPSIWAIPLNSAVITDISPSFCTNNCSNPATGTFREIVQTSSPITLSGTPPATGWVIEYSDCCYGTLTNTFGGGWTFRSIMYPYSNQNSNPCFDSSPYFAEQPAAFQCTGYNFAHNPMAIDPDCDSIAYAWDYALDEPTTTPPAPFAASQVNFTLPYTVSNQFSSNVSLDSHSGFISGNSTVPGNFLTCIKVTSYKCGVKVSDVWRNMVMTFSNGCMLGTSSNINTPPDVNAPFQNPQSGLYTELADTVHAGDTVNFFLNATDFEIGTAAGNNSILQSVQFNATGSEFGAGFTNPNAGCIIPPCATTNPSLPSTFGQGAKSVTFQWVTSINHLCDCNNCTGVITKKTYYFNITSQDNYCPFPAKKPQTLSITILPPAIINAGGTLMFNMALPVNYTYQWYLNGVAISGATFSSYTPSQNGVYTVVINNGGTCNMLSGPFTFPTGINSPLNSMYVTVLANPVNDFLEIKFRENNHERCQLVIYDIAGKQIFEKELPENSSSEKIDVSILFKGIYLAEIRNQEGLKLSQKIVKL